MVVLENDLLKAEISPHGAELRSLARKDRALSYLWNADPAYWARVSPVLFPFVGSVKNKTYRVGDRQYPMGQHGFARDREFELISQTSDEAWFALTDDAQTREIYPFAFCLEIGYRLEGAGIRVTWNVTNPGTEPMYFSIGAHPAFLCPPGEKQDLTSCRVTFYDRDGVSPKELIVRKLGEGGLVSDRTEKLPLTHGCLPVTDELFAKDALILENHQVQQIGLADKKGREFVRVHFEAPLAGVWSPAGKHAPFICIEPWYGRCDAETFDGELKDREWGNRLEGGTCFEASYEIITG